MSLAILPGVLSVVLASPDAVLSNVVTPPTWESLGLPRAVRIVGFIEDSNVDPMTGPDRRVEAIAARDWTEFVVFDRRALGDLMRDYTFATNNVLVEGHHSKLVQVKDNVDEAGNNWFEFHGSAFGVTMSSPIEWARLFVTAVGQGREVVSNPGASETTFSVSFGYSDTQRVHLTVDNDTGRMVRVGRSYNDAPPSTTVEFDDYVELADGSAIPTRALTVYDDSDYRTDFTIAFAAALPPEKSPQIRLLPAETAIVDPTLSLAYDRTLSRTTPYPLDRVGLYYLGQAQQRADWVVRGLAIAIATAVLGMIGLSLRNRLRQHHAKA
ncbi:MAG: hypothetical protein AAGI53_02995 [Planctomycetota bacterium]